VGRRYSLFLRSLFRCGEYSSPALGNRVNLIHADRAVIDVTGVDQSMEPIARRQSADRSYRSLDTHRYIFESYFGSEAAKAFDVVNSVYHEIVASAEILMQMATANPTPQYRESEMPLRNSLGWGVRKPPTRSTRGLKKPSRTLKLNAAPCSRTAFMDNPLGLRGSGGARAD